MNFYRELVGIQAELENNGYAVFIPQSAQVMKDKNDYEVSHFKGVYSYGERSGLIRKNFDEIKKCDAILVINNEKNGVKAYIGANVLMEIAFAFYFRKKIFILHDIPSEASYREEMLCFGVTEIKGKLENIHV